MATGQSKLVKYGVRLLLAGFVLTFFWEFGGRFPESIRVALYWLAGICVLAGGALLLAHLFKGDKSVTTKDVTSSEPNANIANGATSQANASTNAPINADNPSNHKTSHMRGWAFTIISGFSIFTALMAYTLGQSSNPIETARNQDAAKFWAFVGLVMLLFAIRSFVKATKAKSNPS